MKSRWERLLFGVFVAALLLGGCSQTKEALNEEPAAQQLEVEEQGQTLTVVEPEATTKTASEESPKYQIHTRLTDFELLSESSGIAWGLTRNALRIYLTEDSGKTWTNISPAANVQFSSNPKYGKEIYFIDESNGWIVRNMVGEMETIVLRTSDGGQSWKIASLPSAGIVSGIEFSSITDGTVLTTNNTSMGREEKALFRTTDGGAQWKQIMHSETAASANATAEALPYSGYSLGISFLDTNRGLTLLQELGIPKLYQTRDGGASWTSGAEFYEQEHFNTCDGIISGSMSFSSREGWIPVGCNKGESTGYSGYFTTDYGQSWTFAPFELPASNGVNRYVEPFFLNNEQGWYLRNTHFYHTEDQGSSWKVLPESNRLAQMLETYPEVVKYQFISERVGWILIEKSEDKRSLLLQTKDGGANWKVL